MSPDKPREPEQVPGQIELPGMPGEPGKPARSSSGRGSPRSRPARSGRSGGGRSRGGDRVRAEMPQTGRLGQPLPQMDPAAVSDPRFREQVYSLVTGRDANGAHKGDVSAQLKAAYGASKRDPSRPDTAAAAKRLGVTRRTVQRWIKAGKVSKQQAPKVTKAARQSMSTKRGRQQALRQSVSSGTAVVPPLRNSGLVIGGRQGVMSSISDNYRPRETRVGFTDADLAHLQDVWAEHGEAGAAAFFHQHMDRHYEQQWHMPSVSRLSWVSDARNYRRD